MNALNFDQDSFSSFLKNHYKSFDDYSKIEFSIYNTAKINDDARMMESMIHRYCRAIAIDYYDIQFTNEKNVKADIIY